MSESPTRRKPILVWLVGVFVTAGLGTWAWQTHDRANSARIVLEQAKSVSAVAIDELEDWQALDMKVSQAESDVKELRRRIDAAFSSFSRVELYGALKKSFEDLQLNSMVVFSDRGGNYQHGYWLWTPVEGQTLACNLVANGFPSDLPGVDGLRNEFTFPLTPGHLHHVVFNVERHYRQKNSTLSLTFDETPVLTVELPVEPTSTSQQGGINDVFPEPSVLQIQWATKQEYAERVKRGAWHAFEKYTVGFRSRGDSKESPSIQCLFDLVAQDGMFVRQASKSLFEAKGFELSEVGDETSRYFGMFAVLGFNEEDQ